MPSPSPVRLDRRRAPANDRAALGLMRSCSTALPPPALMKSWNLAAGISNCSRPVPAAMFTAHAQDVAEAEEAISDRARQAGFAAILSKPFSLDDLVETVARAVGRSEPFDRSRGAEESRTRELVRALKARGATDVRPSKMREWALFRDHDGAWRQLYWWQGRGVYQLGRYQESGELVMIGQFIDREAALELALPTTASD